MSDVHAAAYLPLERRAWGEVLSEEEQQRVEKSARELWVQEALSSDALKELCEQVDGCW